MPQLFDAGEAREFLQDRILNLLRTHGTGVAAFDEMPGWRFSQPTRDTLLIENTEEPSMPRILISVEVSKT